MINSISFQVSSATFNKDPQSSELGLKILKDGIELMHALGFEAFTFRKLAQKIKSTEASVYRYFESKHKLLLYYTCWYWAWKDYKLTLAVTNIDSPEQRLIKAIRLITQESKSDSALQLFDADKLYQIVMEESSKTYLNKAVDDENKAGVFGTYKRIVETIAAIILEINSNYKYPHMLISTVIEGVHHERYFAVHLPRLTNTITGEDSVECFFEQLVLNAIKK